MDKPPEIMVHAPLTPPTTPDRLGSEKTVSDTWDPTTEEQRKQWRDAVVSNIGLLTPQSIPRKTGKSDHQTPHHDQQQVLPPSLADVQARHMKFRKQMELSPTWVANTERLRVIRERQFKMDQETIDRLTRGFQGSLAEIEGRTFERPVISRMRSIKARARARARARANGAGPEARAATATTTAYVPPPNFGHQPSEAQ